MNGRFRVAALAALVSVLLIAGAVVVAGELGNGFNARTTPVATTVLGMVAVAVPALLALIRTETLDTKADAINEKVDGHMSRLTEELVRAGRPPSETSALPSDAPAPSHAAAPPPSPTP